MPSTKDLSPYVPVIDDSSDDDESDTDAILASLLSKLDELEHQQHETVSAITDQLQKQRREVDTLRKSVHEVKNVIHKKRYSRQKAKIKRLKALKTGTPLVSPSITPKQLDSASVEPVPQDAAVVSENRDVKVKWKKGGGGGNAGFKGMPLLASSSTLSATMVGDSSLNHQDEDTVMMGDDDDDHQASISPALVSLVGTSEAAGVKTVGKKPPSIGGAVVLGAEVAAKEKKRPVQKMVPTRGGMRGRLSGRGRGRGGGTLGSTGSRSDSKEHETAPAPSTNHAKGMGTGRRSKPFARGTAQARSVTSSGGSDGETMKELTTPALAPAPAQSNGFVAVNTPRPPEGPGPSNWMGNDDEDDDPTPLSMLPAGAGKNRPFGEASPRALPPPRSQAYSPEPSPQQNSKRVAFTTPPEPVLFSAKELRATFGGGNPGSIIVNITQEGQANQVVKTPSYICLSPDAHFDPPGTMCDNAEVLDIYGQEDPLDSRTVYPVLKKINKMYMYCGDYTQGAREMIPVTRWKKSSEAVRKFWAKKVQDTEWGREFLVRKGFLKRGEIKNILLPEIMSYFANSDDKVGLRLSTTALNFKTFNMETYKKLVDKALEVNHGLTLAPVSALKSNNLPAKLLTATSSTSPELHKSLEPTRTKKRRRVEEAASEETPASKSIKHPTSAGSERGRRSSRGNVNYRIAPMSEFGVDEGGKEGDVIDLSDEEVEEVDAEQVENEDEESEDEGEMVLD